MNDQQIEQEIQAKGLTAPRVTPADIEANIASEHYFTAEEGFRGAEVRAACEAAQAGDTAAERREWADAPDPLWLLTFCVLVLRNGFTVTGESACASPENFDAELGRKIARQNAISKVWPLMRHARARVSNLSSPAFPPVPDNGASPMQGIETPETADNLPQGVEQ